MGDGQETDQHEQRLREVFDSFDGSGRGCLSPEELSHLCQSLHLDDATPALLRTLQEAQDGLPDGVDFHSFKNALILVLSSAVESPHTEQEAVPRAESPVIQPKFVKGSKRYGRRSTPEFIESVSDLTPACGVIPAGEPSEDNDDSAVPRKRERWNAETTAEEYEAEGQMSPWNPEEPVTPRGAVPAPTAQLEERLREACEELEMSWDGYAVSSQLVALCERLGLEVSGDVLVTLTADRTTNVQEFVSEVVKHNTPPPASTPCRQLRRLHSTQPFDEGGRRGTSGSLTGLQLFSSLDDGTGFTSVDCVLDVWTKEGIENSSEILQALNVDLDGKLSLCDLTVALEDELLVTKNGITQAALASFKAEIRHLGACMDREIREKDKLRSDLDKAERLKAQLAAEMDEQHSAVELMNSLNLRKLEQEHRDKMSAVQSELRQEMDLVQQQAGLQREQLEAEIHKVKEDEAFLRDHLSMSLKENRRLEMELLDCTEKLVETQSQMNQLQTNLDNITKDKLDDLDQGSADFLLQEERIKQLHCSYEAQCRELQDRIDELQSELQDFHSLNRSQQACSKPLSEELDSKSPGMDSDPGIGSEEVRPFSLSLESEMMLEQLKEEHLQQVEELQNQLQTKVAEADEALETQRAAHEQQKATLILQHQQEVQGLKSHRQELQNSLQQAKQEQSRLQQQQVQEREELQALQEEELGGLRQQLLEAHTYTADLEEQMKNLESEQTECDGAMEELRRNHRAEVQKLKEDYAELVEEKAAAEQRLSDDWAREKKLLEQSHQHQLEKVTRECEEERADFLKSLTEQWQKEREQLDEQNTESLQLLLEEEMLKLVREQEAKEKKLREQLQQQHEKDILERLEEERSHFEQREKRLKEEWERERLQLEEDYEGMVQERLSEEREKLEADREEDEERWEKAKEERECLEEKHREAVKELRARHAEERDTLSSTLDKLRDDIALERREMELSFNRKIKEMAERFAEDQESVTQRFQADVWKVELHYQSELQVLSEQHKEQEVQWEAEKLQAVKGAEEQNRRLQEAMEEELQRLCAERLEEQQEHQRLHSEELQQMGMKNKQLQDELDGFLSQTQTKEIELSQQLNDLHQRLQESLRTKQQLLTQSEAKAVEMELLLNRTVEDFKQERAELLNNYAELEAKHSEMISLSNKSTTEKMELQTECHDLRLKNRELEMLLEQAALDFELERKELQENVDHLQKRWKVKINESLEGASESAEHFEAPAVTSGDTEAEGLPPCGDGGTQDCSDGDQDVLREAENAVPVQEDFSLEVDVGCDEYRESLVFDEDRDEAFDWTPFGHSHREAPGDCLLDGNKNDKQSEWTLEESSGNDLHGMDGPEGAATECRRVGLTEAVEHHQPAADPGDLTKPPRNPEWVGVSPWGRPTTKDTHGRVGDSVETGDGGSGERREAAHISVQEENLVLYQKIFLLQQKTEILENLMSFNQEKVQTFHQIIEENHSLKVRMLLLMEHIRGREMAALKMADLLIQYEECLCENDKLKDQNTKLQNKVWILEAGINMFPKVQSQQSSVSSELVTIEEDSLKLRQMFEGHEQQDETLSLMDGEGPETALVGLNRDLDTKDQAGTDWEDSCLEFERGNRKLRLAITELQDKSQTLDDTTQANRCEAHRLADENAILSHKIAALKNEDLKEAHEELLKALNHLRKENGAAQKAAESGRKQISGLLLQKQQLEKDNQILSEENARTSADVTSLRQQLETLMEENSMRASLPAEERNELAACVSELEAELTKALEDSARLAARNLQLSQQLSEYRGKAFLAEAVDSQLSHLVEECKSVDKETVGLRNQLSEAQEKVKSTDETLQALNRQSARLKSDLRALQQERDGLRQDVAVLSKQLQNANDRNGILETAVHSGGLQLPSKKQHREDVSRLMDPELQLLRQENHRLQAHVCSLRADLGQCREKVSQLDATIASLKQRKQQSPSSVMMALEQENAALKQELQAQHQANKDTEAGRLSELHHLQQENEALKARLAQRSTQLLESFQAQLVGLLPPSPHRMPRGQQRGEEPDVQDVRGRKMKVMEERMREVELSLQNVKVLLKEKVVQLKEQLHKNGKAEVLIKDLHVENGQLLRALEVTEQRQKIAEKKNYLLEEKISSLNRIVRELNPSPLTASLPYLYK